MEKPCPHCRQTVPDGKRICPHCGASLPADGKTSGGAWAPSPARYVPGFPAERLLTGRRWLDFVLGFVPPPVVIVLFLAAGGQGRDWLTGLSGAALLGMAVSYLVLQRRFPVVARGIGWGMASLLIGVVLLLLGILAVCLYPTLAPRR